MKVFDFLFRGWWGMVPKPVFYFLGGWILCGILERGGNDGVIATGNVIVGVVGTILGALSLWYSLKQEK